MQDLGSMNLAVDHMLDIRCRQDMEGAFGYVGEMGTMRAVRPNSKMLHRLWIL